jgi:creatinine amidohydrolase
MLYVAPQLVRMELARDSILPDSERRRYRRGTRMILPGASEGSIGEPTLASAEKGKRLYEFIRGVIRERVLGAGAEALPE